jgi:hypothetical protein
LLLNNFRDCLILPFLVDRLDKGWKIKEMIEKEKEQMQRGQRESKRKRRKEKGELGAMSPHCPQPVTSEGPVDCSGWFCRKQSWDTGEKSTISEGWCPHL